jgi:alpha-tubulin suppressor-like RCC1 family protein
VGETHSCALTNAGGVVCWGANDRGQLGNGVNSGPSWSPVPVTNLSSDVTAISAANDHSCALRAGGDVWCWGNNFGGQLGDGTTLDSNVPVTVALLPGDVVAIGSGSFYNCALTAGGEVWCWGDGSAGDLGDGRLFESLVPVPVAGLSSPQVPALGTSAGLVLLCVLVAVGAAAHRRRVIPLRS